MTVNHHHNNSKRAMEEVDIHLVRIIMVRDIMTPDPVTVHPDTLLLHAVRLLLANKFSALPVVDDSGDLLGIVTERDLLRELAADLQERAIEEAGLSMAKRKSSPELVDIEDMPTVAAG